MEINDKLIFLKVLNGKGKIDTLIKAGYTYSEVGGNCNELVEAGLIKEKGKNFELTELGRNQLKEMISSRDKRGIEKYILEFSKFNRVRLLEDEVYIPQKMKYNK